MLRAVSLSMLALGLSAQGTPATVAPAPAPARVPTQPAPKPEEIILAKIGGETITEADFQAVVQAMPQQQRMQLMMVEGGKDEFIKRMVDSKLLALKARKMDLDKSPVFQRTVERTKDDLLAREFLTKESENLQKKLAVNDEQLKVYYEGHKDKFKQGERASAKHILVLVKAAGGEGQGLPDAEAKKRVAKIQAEMKLGKKFDELAKKYSEDPGSKDRGGLIEDFDPKQMVPEFAKAVETQPLGKVGAPIKTQYGYHLIKVEKRMPAKQLSFDEAKNEVQQAATQERQTQVWNELMDGLKKEFPVEISTKPKAPVAPAPATQPVMEKSK
jgi:peptidyl-prolyl cis-trans isomerase C